MTCLRLKVSDLILKDSIEYYSLTDFKKPNSILDVITNGLRTNKKERQMGGGRSIEKMEIPLDDIEIINIDSGEISDEGIIFQNAQAIYEGLDSYDPNNLYPQNRYDYIKNLSLWNLKTKIDVKNYIKRCYFSKQNKKLLDKNTPKILFFDPYFSNMYHFLFEAYPRLLILIDYLKKQNIEKFYVIAPPIYRWNKKYHQWYINDIFNMLGIKEDRIIYLDYKIAKANNVYISTCPRCNPSYVLPAIKKLQTHFYEDNFKNLGTRIYISRKKSHYRYLSNEEEIYEILQKEYGFVKINMEDYNLKEKINIMMNADTTISVDGTSAINGCFMTKNNAKLIALRPHEMSEFQLLIPSMFKNIDYLPIVCQVSDKIGENIWSMSNLYLEPNYLRKKLQEYKL